MMRKLSLLSNERYASGSAVLIVLFNVVEFLLVSFGLVGSTRKLSGLYLGDDGAKAKGAPKVDDDYVCCSAAPTSPESKALQGELWGMYGQASLAVGLCIVALFSLVASYVRFSGFNDKTGGVVARFFSMIDMFLLLPYLFMYGSIVTGSFYNDKVNEGAGGDFYDAGCRRYTKSLLPTGLCINRPASSTGARVELTDLGDTFSLAVAAFVFFVLGYLLEHILEPLTNKTAIYPDGTTEGIPKYTNWCSFVFKDAWRRGRPKSLQAVPLGARKEEEDVDEQSTNGRTTLVGNIKRRLQI
jgi:hypothetical protein